ncbi:MAG TPA: hypothetical protein VFI03_02280 [Solirubrobacterales bacterium]|nr:hypothetical protein [Solirubrobacterales bacterium]
MLIEILVSAVVLVIASAGVITLLQTTIKTQAEERHGSEAYALAQEDQARLTSMRLEALAELQEERTITLNKTQFKVHSSGMVINDVTSASSCTEGTSSVDYVQISSMVTWRGMKSAEKAKIVSKLSPSNGSLDPENGSLTVSVANQLMAPMAGVDLYGGSGVIDGYTDAAGCAVFSFIPRGNYSLTISGADAGLVNKQGKSSEQATVAVVGGATKPVFFEFDRPGTIPVNFKYRVGSTSTFMPAKADSVIAYNTGMKEARGFGLAGGAREATLNATPLFPFSSVYTFYAGSCASNHPDPEGKNPAGAAAMASMVAPAGGTASPAAMIQLPALELVVKKSAALLKGAKATVTDKVCKDAKGNLVKRTYTTNESGMLSSSETGPTEGGLPWGKYEVCVSANISGTVRRKKESSVTVQNLASGTPLPIELSSGNEKGEC